MVSVDNHFKIGVTFSGKYRDNFIKPACEALLNFGYDEGDIFFDEWHEHLVNGVHADDKLIDIYENCCECVVVLLSPDYGDKSWTGHVEWRAIRNLINKTDADKLCLLSVGGCRPSDIPGLYSEQDISKDIDSMSSAEIAAFIDKVYSRVHKRSDDQSADQSASQESFDTSFSRIAIRLGCRQGTITVLGDTLHQLYRLERHFIEKGCHPVEAHIEFEDVDDFVRDMIQALTNEWALTEDADQMQVAKQLFASNRTAREEVINRAISFMLCDEGLDRFNQNHALLERSLARFDRLGIKLDEQDLFYVNDYGKECYYQRSFLWAEIIEILAKWFISNEVQRRANDRAYDSLDVIYKDKIGATVWYFMTFVSAGRGEDEYQCLYSILRHYAPVADVWDIPWSEVVDNVLPDFYCAIGSMQSKAHPWSYDDIIGKHGNKAFDLASMVIGPH